MGRWSPDERLAFQDSAKPRRASSLKNRHPKNLLLEHVGAPRAVTPPCVGAASTASPPRAGAAAPPQARWAGAAAPPRARRAGAAAPPPSPASLMARLTPCACLRKEKLLDSLLGDRRWWCWDFLVPRLMKFLAGQDLY
jgi:hypothetical protein